MIQIKEEEYYAICALAHEGAELQGEDVIGGLMKQGTFRLTEVVDLSDKIKDGKAKYYKLIAENIAEEKKKRNREKQKKVLIFLGVRQKI